MIPISQPLLDGNEKRYLMECIDSGWVGADGPFVARFERQMAGYTRRRFGVACSSGSAALELAVQALELKPGDEVILPALTIISCVAPLLRLGLVPVFADCCPLTFNMQPSDLEACLSVRTKAVIIVHLYGLTVDLAPVLALAATHRLKVIEDAAQMLGQQYQGMPCGSFGDISVFSFYPNKQVTTGEGGMVLTNDETLAERCRRLRNLAFDPDPARRFIHDVLAFNYRLSNLQAAVGLAQLEKIDRTVEQKRRIGQYYQELLTDLPKVQLPLTEMPYCRNLYWAYTIVLQDDSRHDVKKVTAALSTLGIASRPLFFPLHLQPVVQALLKQPARALPHAERLYQRGFYIPSGPALTEVQQRQIVQALYEVLV